VNVVMRLVAHLTGIALKLIDSKLNSKTIKVQAQENISSIKKVSPSRFINFQRQNFQHRKKSSLIINIG